MALISAKTIITSLSLFHVMLGYFFLTNPGTLADQAIVYMLGEAMGMPYERGFAAQSGPLAFLAVVIAFWGLTDLVSLSLPEEVCLINHWGTQAPLRFLISLLLLGYTFLLSSSSPFYRDEGRGWMAAPTVGYSSNYAPSGWGGDGLKNRVFFVFIFVEMISWLWVWVTLKEETREILLKKAKRRPSFGYGR
ncbi:hypothetical protein N0V82_006033 [Gnomoniopsis sp. IMI 355080]|nr:hypothetical protein N0V82_006033 [Gnomoniopsis sp. IMI 355080]